MTDSIADDVAAVARIDAVPTILDVVCRATGLGFSAVARVTEDRWIACAVRDEIEFGLAPGGELEVNSTICDEIRASGQMVVIDHVARDETFRDHHTPRRYGLQSYISVPIYRPDGRFFGTLCGLDRRPARLNTPATVGMFKLFADLIGFHLDVQDRLTISETTLLDERKTAELREQFIAVLGHDLRNPLASIDAGAKLLLRLPLEKRAAELATLIESSARRMAGLIGNILDFAHGRLGGGLPISPTTAHDLEALLGQVVAELRTAVPGRVIEVEMALDRPVACDVARVAQLVSNLLANALTHGDPHAPVRLAARAGAADFEVRVSNRGAQIPAHRLDRLFEPFTRQDSPAGAGVKGLGLGLYIASEIARAHGGTLTATSSPEETCFTFRMPAGS